MAERGLHAELLEDVDATLARRRHATHLQCREERRARRDRVSLQCLGDEQSTAPERCIVELELSMPPLCTLHDSRRHELEHPSRIHRRDEVQRAAHRPRPGDRSIRDGAFDIRARCARDAKTDGPEGARVILRLNGAELCDDRFGRLCRGPRDALRIPTKVRDIGQGI
jgi:hypothetical protein